MTSYERLEFIKNKLQTGLPEVLQKANLAEFDNYKVGEPLDMQQNTVSVFTLDWKKDLTRENWQVNCVFQLYGDYNIYKYESILFDALPKLFTAEDIDFNILEGMESMVLPPQQTSSVFVFISLSFTRYFDCNEGVFN